MLAKLSCISNVSLHPGGSHRIWLEVEPRRCKFPFVNGRCHCLRQLEKGIHSNGHAHGFRPQAQKLPCESTSQKEAYLNGDIVSFRSRI